jgi:hypothetical protein
MRLLEYSDGKLSFTEDLVHNIPSYAILSHTWGSNSEEVTYRDIKTATGEKKTGYKKIWFCAEQAKRDGLRYFWVDTCCIDKFNFTELTGAIASMFRWYREATHCYVYLSDVSITGHGDQIGVQLQAQWESAFRASVWFTRGWTLQELLAPASVGFFTPEGYRLGNKSSLEQQVHEITGIPVRALRGGDLSQFDIDERFKWAESRKTTREEDWAYSLFGIFGVFIPLIYGEGKENAIRRLRKEVEETLGRQRGSLSPYRPSFLLLIVSIVMP